MEALGLKSDYDAEGRVITQALDSSTLPGEVRRHQLSLQALGAVYKQLDAPFGQFGQDSETVSTRAVQSTSPGEATYKGFDRQLEQCASARETVAGEINRLLSGVEFEGAHVSDAEVVKLAVKGGVLIGQMDLLAHLPQPPQQSICG
jgi:hypothetical protein